MSEKSVFEHSEDNKRLLFFFFPARVIADGELIRVDHVTHNMTSYTCDLILLKGIDPNRYIHVNIHHLSVNFCSPFIQNCQQYTHDRMNSNNTHIKGILRIISE